MKMLRGAVVGLGYWGPNIIRNFIKIPGVTIASVCDISDNALRSFRKEYPFIKTTNNLNVILNDESIEFISIATPLSSHYEIARKSILAGKHVLLEKPFTQTSTQAKKLIALQKKKKKVLMVGHTFVYSESIKKIQSILAAKSFGELSYYDSTRINLGRFQSDTNVIWDLATHDFSILDAVLPTKPLSIQAMGSSPISKNQYEIAHVFLTFPNHFTVHIHVSWLSPVKIRTILIGGTTQMIKYDDIEPSEKIRIYNKSILLKAEDITPFSPAYRSGTVTIPHLRQKEPLLSELEHFVDCMRNGKKPLTDGTSGMRVVQLLEAVDKSLQTSKIIHFYGSKK